MVIEDFRRLKFRMEKRHKNIASGELMFLEHFVFDKYPDVIEDSRIEYEDLSSTYAGSLKSDD